MPGMTLSTDIIVGFPSETEDDFRQTLSLIEQVQFDWGFIFKYSTREGTPAAHLECHPEALIEERHQRCLELVDRIALAKRSKLVGTIHEVLVEQDNFGRTRTNYKVHINGGEAQARQGAGLNGEAQARQGAASSNIAPGEIVRVRITNAQRATLEGELENGNITFENFR